MCAIVWRGMFEFEHKNRHKNGGEMEHFNDRMRHLHLSLLSQSSHSISVESEREKDKFVRNHLISDSVMNSSDNNDGQHSGRDSTRAKRD